MHILPMSEQADPRTATPFAVQDTFTRETLAGENRRFANTGGISRENRSRGFRPAFQDCQTGLIYASRFNDGRPAPFHAIDGLPEELVIERSVSGAVTALKPTLIAGFLRGGRFYTREQAARATTADTVTNRV